MTSIPSITKINKMIKDRGYLSTTLDSTLRPSIYLLEDDTIVMASLNLTYLLPDATQDELFNVNHASVISCLVKEDQRKPDQYDPNLAKNPSLHVSDYDMDFQTIQERFTPYRLNNGIIVSVKPILTRVDKTAVYNITGEPVYLVSVTPVLKTNARNVQSLTNE